MRLLLLAVAGSSLDQAPDLATSRAAGSFGVTEKRLRLLENLESLLKFTP